MEDQEKEWDEEDDVEYPDEVYEMAESQGITTEEAYEIWKEEEEDDMAVLEASRGQY